MFCPSFWHHRSEGTPGLVAAGENLVSEGCETVLVVPLFFGQGGHVREDVPALVDALRSRVPNVTVTQSPTAGEDELVLEALASFCVRGI